MPISSFLKFNTPLQIVFISYKLLASLYKQLSYWTSRNLPKEVSALFTYCALIFATARKQTAKSETIF
jgi:hypothetical protein